MRKVIDLTGQKFGRLVVVNRIEDYIRPNGKHRVRWHCRCECGNERDVIGDNLKLGHTLSCGCYRDERMSECRKKTNKYEIMNNYIVAKTNDGTEFFVDKDDEWVFENYCFCLSNGYLCARDCNGGKSVYLHRLVMNCPNDMVVDHINGDPTDNRKSNLRVVAQQQNMMNLKIYSNNTSGVSGVWFNEAIGKWQANIRFNNKSIHLGLFDSFSDAVSARRAAEQKYFGEYSFDNSRNRTAVC